MAVTEIRSVFPASACVTAYVSPVAPLTAAQLSPPASHRSQLTAVDVGLPLHVPLFAVKVAPA